LKQSHYHSLTSYRVTLGSYYRKHSSCLTQPAKNVNAAIQNNINLFEEGELAADELKTALGKVVAEYDPELVRIITYGRYSEIQLQRWQAEQAAFFEHNPNFSRECNPILFNALNAEVIRIAHTSEAKGKTGLQILYEAKATIETIFGKGEA